MLQLSHPFAPQLPAAVVASAVALAAVVAAAVG